MSQEEEIRC